VNRENHRGAGGVKPIAANMEIAMRKVILMMLLAVVSSNAVAEWVAVTHNKTVFVYADPATIRKAGNMVKMWELIDFKTVQLPDKNKPYMSIKYQLEFDCNKEQSRILTYYAYSGNMGGGEMAGFSSNPDKWEPVVPDAASEFLWQTACGKL
jgi:hypothetical protein